MKWWMHWHLCTQQRSYKKKFWLISAKNSLQCDPCHVLLLGQSLTSNNILGADSYIKCIEWISTVSARSKIWDAHLFLERLIVLLTGSAENSPWHRVLMYLIEASRFITTHSHFHFYFSVSYGKLNGANVPNLLSHFKDFDYQVEEKWLIILNIWNILYCEQLCINCKLKLIIPDLRLFNCLTNAHGFFMQMLELDHMCHFYNRWDWFDACISSTWDNKCIYCLHKQVSKVMQ